MLRIGVIGVGVMGADHVERLARRTAGAQLVALADADVARAALLAREYGVRAVADPLALAVSQDIDAVLIASPGFAHEDQVLACIEHGKYVLCEKPLTMDAESSLRVVRAERSAGRRLVQVGFMRRFDPGYAELKAVVDSGELGRLLVLHNIHRNRSAKDPAFRSEMIVRDSLVHEVDVTRWLFGQEIVSVQVICPRSTSYAPAGVADPQLAIFEMAGGGSATNEVFVNAQVGYEVRCEAVAELGSLSIDGGWSTLTRSAGRWGGRVPEGFRDRFAAAYDLELQGWVDACRAGTVVGPGSIDGYASTVACTAGMRSLREGGPVRVELDPVSTAVMGTAIPTGAAPGYPSSPPSVTDAAAPPAAATPAAAPPAAEERV